MRRKQLILTVLGAAMLALAAADTDTTYQAGQHVVICSIEDMIDDGITVVVERAVEEARRENAAAIIFEIDTPGGLVDAALDTADAIMQAPCPTVAYVRGAMGALSAGALISMACDDITMAPAANIGAATPVLMSPQGNMPTDEKSVSFLRAKFRSFAEENGYSPALAEAMVDADIELRAYEGEGGEQVIRAIQPGSGPGVSEESTVREEVVDRIIDAFNKKVPMPDDVNETARDVAAPQEGRGSLPESPEGGEPPEGKIILPSGKLLTMTATEAKEFGLIEVICGTRAEVLSYFGYSEMAVKQIEATWAEDFFRFITNPMISGWLILFGIGGLYMEIKTPGFGLPGLIGLVCLGLFFGARVVLGLAEVMDLLLVLVGISLLVVEIFLLPGFGIPGSAGIICILAGFYLALTRVVIPEYSWDYQRLGDAAQTLGIAAVLLTLGGILAWRYLPRTRLFGRLIQQSAQYADAGYVVQTEEDESAIGFEGVALTPLHPSGRGRFEGKTYNIVSNNEYIEKGERIIIVQIEGNRYVVDPIRRDTSGDED